jgi:hypothetical protein
MIPTIYIGTSASFLDELQTTLKLKLETNPDVFMVNLDAGHLGVTHVQEIQKFLLTRPYQATYKYVIIPNAHSLSNIAQNALLKTLEEPPVYAHLSLQVTNQDQLLPTIISRCLVKRLAPSPSVPLDPSTSYYKELNQADIAGKIKLAEKFRQRDQALGFISSLMQEARLQLINQPTLDDAKLLDRLHQAHQELQQNANPQLTLETLLFSLERNKYQA